MPRIHYSCNCRRARVCFRLSRIPAACFLQCWTRARIGRTLQMERATTLGFSARAEQGHLLHAGGLNFALVCAIVHLLLHHTYLLKTHGITSLPRYQWYILYCGILKLPHICKYKIAIKFRYFCQPLNELDKRVPILCQLKHVEQPPIKSFCMRR